MKKSMAFLVGLISIFISKSVCAADRPYAVVENIHVCPCGDVVASGVCMQYPVWWEPYHEILVNPLDGLTDRIDSYRMRIVHHGLRRVGLRVQDRLMKAKRLIIGKWRKWIAQHPGALGEMEAVMFLLINRLCHLADVNVLNKVMAGLTTTLPIEHMTVASFEDDWALLCSGEYPEI